MKEIKDIMYKNDNNEYNNKYKSETNKITSSKDKILLKDEHSIFTSNINKIKKQKSEKNYSNENNIELNIKKIKEKISDKDYQLIYNAKIIEGKYRKKNENNINIFSNKENNKFN